MGIDRALAIYGAGEVYGYPSLVIDGGTALTFTGVDCSQTLVGGAILPGLRSQFKLLDEQTAALPLVELAAALPHRWATDTPDAIRSGIIHTLVAGIYSFIMDWLQYFPQSQIVLTGGDSKIIERYLQQQFPTLAQKIVLDEALLFRGLQQVVTN
jgi:type III pantothenate kinase